jgi:uncharacterized protein
MPLFFIVFFSVYSAVNYYIFIRGWQALQGLPVLRIAYLGLFLVSALSYILARVFAKVLPLPVYDIMTWIGSFWFAYILYLFLFILLIDLLRLGNHFFDYFPASVNNNFLIAKRITIAAVFLISSLIIAAGYINTRIINITSVELSVPKRASNLDRLRIAVASDIHLSTINDKKLLADIVSKINELDPDIVLLPGDIVDDHSEYLIRKGIGEGFRDLRPRFGTFASMGNHEFINGAAGSADFITSQGIRLLRDEYHLLDGNFYIVGREDSSKSSFTKERRKTLKEILQGLNPEYPVILMDHTPWRLEEAAYNQVDLQVSGHTHHGQLFPLNYITSIIYEVSRGYKKKQNTHFFVSSGAGTWGPPVRTGSTTEIVLIDVKFDQ